MTLEDDKVTLSRLSFGGGAILILCWFVWSTSTSPAYTLEEWAVFYVIALLCWQPISTWLITTPRWIPAAEVFFFLHLPYYVSPFLRGDLKYAELDSSTRLQIALVIFVFLITCRLFHRIPRKPVNLGGNVGYFLNGTIGEAWHGQLAWGAFGLWALVVISLRKGWFIDLGSYYQTFRTIVYNAGNIGMFVLSYQMGRDRLSPIAKKIFLTTFMLIALLEITSGFLITAALESAVICLGYSFTRRKLPIVTITGCSLIFAFLHLGKADMRSKFWAPGVAETSLVTILSFWASASWSRLTAVGSDNDGTVSLLERGNLLSYTSKVVSETPTYIPYLGGLTYAQTATTIVPRFLWPDKPRASTPNETLAIHYGFQDTESVETTAISLGKISEGWGNFGWLGVVSAGVIMGLLLQIPTKLSRGYTPLHVRFLLAVPFIWFAMTLEECLGPGIHPLLGALALTSPFLWLAAAPSKDLSGSTPHSVTIPPAAQQQTVT